MVHRGQVSLLHAAEEEILLVPRHIEPPDAIPILQKAEIAAASVYRRGAMSGKYRPASGGPGGRDLERVSSVLGPCLVRVRSVSSRR